MNQSWNRRYCIDHDPELKPKILYWSWIRVETEDIVLIMIQSWNRRYCIDHESELKSKILYWSWIRVDIALLINPRYNIYYCPRVNETPDILLIITHGLIVLIMIRIWNPDNSILITLNQSLNHIYCNYWSWSKPEIKYILLIINRVQIWGTVLIMIQTWNPWVKTRVFRQNSRNKAQFFALLPQHNLCAWNLKLLGLTQCTE